MSLLVVLTLLTLLSVWSIVCIERAYRQQIKLIEDIHEANMASDLSKFYWHVIDAVSLTEHARRLFTFRDPWAIYPPDLVEVRKLAK